MSRLNFYTKAIENLNSNIRITYHTLCSKKNLSKSKEFYNIVMEFNEDIDELYKKLYPNENNEKLIKLLSYEYYLNNYDNCILHQYDHVEGIGYYDNFDNLYRTLFLINYFYEQKFSFIYNDVFKFKGDSMKTLFESIIEKTAELRERLPKG